MVWKIKESIKNETKEIKVKYENKRKQTLNNVDACMSEPFLSTKKRFLW